MKGHRLPARLVTGVLLLCLPAMAALASLVWTPVAQPARLRISEKLLPPLQAGLAGTDQLGRDVFSLIMLGAQNSLFIATLAVCIGGTAGCLIGLFAAMQRGRAESILMRAMDVLFAFPPVLSALMLATLLGSGRLNAITAIALFMVPVFARIARAAALRLQAQDYIRAAQALGAGEAEILMRHILPGIAGELAVQASVQFGLAIITEAGLSFIGLGLAPPEPSWGRMLAEWRTYFTLAPWLVIAPGLAIAITVMGASLTGDGLRDRFDPRGSR